MALVSIGRIVAIVLVVTSCIAAAGAAAQIVLTSALTRAAGALRLSVDGVRLSEEVRVDLLRYVRRSDLAALGSADDETRRAMLERELYFKLAELERTARDSAEERLAADVAAHVTAYLVVRRSAEAQYQDLAAIIRETTPELEVALSAAARLTDINVSQARQAALDARRWDGLSNAIGAAIVLIMLGLVPMALSWLSARVLRPLVNISAAMERYASGAAASRVPPMGASELQQIGHAFNTLADVLREQHHRQATSIAAIAHDLRNPLNALRMATATADRDSSPEAMARAFTIVRRQTDRLERMVSDLLDSAYIEAGQIELRLKPCDVRGPLSSAFELYSAASPTHRLRLAMPPEPVVVTCDRLRIEQVLTNLLSNAVKYSPSGSAVDVELRVDQSQCVITVADEGIGIPPSAMRRLFEPFHRGKVLREDIPGTGLGLSVVKRIIEAHGGEVSVFSTEGRGSIFRVSLPSSTLGEDVVSESPGTPRGIHAPGDRRSEERE